MNKFIPLTLTSLDSCFTKFSSSTGQFRTVATLLSFIYFKVSFTLVLVYFSLITLFLHILSSDSHLCLYLFYFHIHCSGILSYLSISCFYLYVHIIESILLYNNLLHPNVLCINTFCSSLGYNLNLYALFTVMFNSRVDNSTPPLFLLF